LVVKIVEDHTFEIFQRAQLETFNAWLDNIPQELIRESEILAVRKSIGLFITGRVKEAFEHL
jgi:ATP/maltotriose-dependent transcriptional regulator MalT